MAEDIDDKMKRINSMYGEQTDLNPYARHFTEREQQAAYAFIRSMPSISQSQMARALGLKPATMSKVYNDRKVWPNTKALYHQLGHEEFCRQFRIQEMDRIWLMVLEDRAQMKAVENPHQQANANRGFFQIMNSDGAAQNIIIIDWLGKGTPLYYRLNASLGALGFKMIRADNGNYNNGREDPNESNDVESMLRQYGRADEGWHYRRVGNVNWSQLRFTTSTKAYQYAMKHYKELFGIEKMIITPYSPNQEEWLYKDLMSFHT